MIKSQITNNIQYQKSNDSNTALLSVSVWNFLHWKLVFPPALSAVRKVVGQVFGICYL